MRFLDALEQFVADSAVGRAADRDLRRPEHRQDRARRASEGAQAGSIGQLPEERAQLERIIAHGLVDVGRALDPENDEMFTWWAPWRNMRQRNIGWRLDYLLASESLYQRVRSCIVQREFGTSDHAPVIAEFDL